MKGQKVRKDEDSELERLCSRCGEYWPADREFFYGTGRRVKGKLHNWCKACCKEAKTIRRKRKVVT